MSARHYTDEQVTLWHGDCRDVLPNLPDASVDCIVTSPPYLGLRDYGSEHQLGREVTPAEFASALVGVLEHARRVLRDDGTVWLNLGDSYAHSRPSGRQGETGGRSGRRYTATGAGGAGVGVPDKNLLGVPWRVAFALQDAGWFLRNEIVWFKPNSQPASVQDRLTNKHETVFLLSKRPTYWFDLDAIREPHAATSVARAERGDPSHVLNPAGRNPGDVWTINTQPFPGMHDATMPVELARRCIRAGCRPGGTVLDPFSGSGTTGMAANELGRRYVGIDVNAEYLDLSLSTRLAQPTLALEVAG